VPYGSTDLPPSRDVVDDLGVLEDRRAAHVVIMVSIVDRRRIASELCRSHPARRPPVMELNGHVIPRSSWSLRPL
jgi:hypothetical protein